MGSKHRNLYQSSLATRRVNHIILRAYTGTCVRHRTQEKLGKGFGEEEEEKKKKKEEEEKKKVNGFLSVGEACVL